MHTSRNTPVRKALVAAACAIACTAGCSRAGSSDAPVAVASAAPAPATPAQPGTVCAMLDAAAMSEILGEPLFAEPNDAALDNGHSDCVYRDAGGHKRLDVAVDRLGGDMMREVLGIPDGGPATADNPYADIGDGANLQQGVLFGMLGQVRVSIDLSRIDDKHAVAERVFAALEPALAP